MESVLGFINTIIITDLSSTCIIKKYLIHKLSKVKPAFYHGVVDALLITIIAGTYQVLLIIIFTTLLIGHVA